MFPCLCAQGSSIAEYSLVAVKRDTCVLVCLYALRGFTRPSYISGGGGGGGWGGGGVGGGGGLSWGGRWGEGGLSWEGGGVVRPQKPSLVTT